MEKSNFISHAIELRKRLTHIFLFFILSFAICYFYAENIYDFLLRPLIANMNDEVPRRLIYTGLAEAFTSYLKLAFFVGILISFPYINLQLSRFISPGLYKNEKKFFNSLLILSPFLFYFGCFFAYQVIFPLAWKFFLTFESFSGSMPITLEARVSEYLALSQKIILAFGIVFELPVVLILMIKSGVISVKSLAKKRKYALLIFFVIGAVITPPDIISQIGIAIPMYLLFELTLLFARRL